MSKHTMPLPDLVIANGQTDSNVLKSHGVPTAPDMATTGDGFRDADTITINAPDTLPEAVVVHVDSAESTVNFNPLMRDGGQVLLSPGEAVTIDGLSFKALKLVATPAVAGTRTFKVTKEVWV